MINIRVTVEALVACPGTARAPYLHWGSPGARQLYCRGRLFYDSGLPSSSVSGRSSSVSR